MLLKAYEEVCEEPLAFLIGGKVYTPPPISAKLGIWLIRVFAGDVEAVAEQDFRSVAQILLGDTYEEMLDDGVPMSALTRAGYAMLLDWQVDRERAIEIWESGLNPEARAAQMAATLQSTTEPTSTPTPSTPPAAATTTRKPGYTTGTRKTPKKQPAKKAPRSRSSSSSSTGR